MSTANYGETLLAVSNASWPHAPVLVPPPGAATSVALPRGQQVHHLPGCFSVATVAMLAAAALVPAQATHGDDFLSGSWISSIPLDTLHDSARADVSRAFEDCLLPQLRSLGLLEGHAARGITLDAFRTSINVDRQQQQHVSGGARTSLHRDASGITINCALADPLGYVGGGTYFPSSYEANGELATPAAHGGRAAQSEEAFWSATGWVLKSHAGGCIAHNARVYHSAVPPEGGTRITLIAFLKEDGKAIGTTEAGDAASLRIPALEVPSASRVHIADPSEAHSALLSAGFKLLADEAHARSLPRLADEL